MRTYHRNHMIKNDMENRKMRNLQEMCKDSKLMINKLVIAKNKLRGDLNAKIELQRPNKPNFSIN